MKIYPKLNYRIIKKEGKCRNLNLKQGEETLIFRKMSSSLKKFPPIVLAGVMTPQLSN